MPMTLAVPLDWSDVRVFVHRMLEDGTVLIEVESTLRTTRCHRCSREIGRFHGVDRPIWLRHFNSGNWITMFGLRTGRVLDVGLLLGRGGGVRWCAGESPSGPPARGLNQSCKNRRDSNKRRLRVST